MSDSAPEAALLSERFITDEPEPEAGFSDRMKTAMKERGLSTRDLQRLTERVGAPGKGLSYTILLQYQKGVKPGLRELRVLSQALDVSPLYLMLGDAFTHRITIPLKQVMQPPSGPAPDARDSKDQASHSLETSGRDPRSMFRTGRGIRSPLTVGVVIEHLPPLDRDALLVIIESMANRAIKASPLHELVKMSDMAFPILAQALDHSADPKHRHFDYDAGLIAEMRSWVADRLAGVVPRYPSIWKTPTDQDS